jgi:peptidoglycan/LPS O-acetylase OafA/YrhL
MATMKQLPVLTGLRGVAAYAVLVAHAIDIAFIGRRHADVVGLAYFGMSLFFVLSGFVIAYNYPDVRGLQGSWRFFVARFARLYPLYIAVLIVSRAIYPPDAPYNDFFADPFAGVAGLTMTQSWFNVQGIASWAFGQSWSISTEWGFYAAFPFLALIAVHRPLRVLIVFLLMAFITCSVLYLYRDQTAELIAPYVRSGRPLNAPVWWWLTYFSPFLRLLEFVAGMLVCRAYLDRATLPRWILPACLMMVATLIVASRWPTDGWALDMLRTFAFAPFLALAILALCSAPSLVSRALSCRVLQLAGEISYSVYALQFLVFALLSRYMAKDAVFCGVSIVLITALAAVTYWLYEKPARLMVRWLLTRPVARVTAAAE